MANSKAILRRVTGSADEPIPDMLSRAAILGGLTGLLTFANNKLDWLTDADVADLGPVLVVAAIGIGGLWDHFVKPRIRGRTRPG